MPLQDDVQAAVEALVPQKLSFTRTAGRVDQAQAFAELREIVLTVLALDPNAILRLIEIAKDRTLAAVVEEFDLATQLTDALTAISTGPATTPIRSALSLGNAEAALTNLQANVSSGFVSSDDLNSAKASIDVFLSTQVSANVRSGGLPITTKEEGVRIVRSILPTLIEAHQETLRLLIQLEIVFKEFFDADLRVVVGNTLLGKSRQMVADIQSISTFSPADSAANSAVHLAQLTTIKRLLTSYFESPGPLDTRLEGTVANSLRLQPIGDGTPATLLSTTVVRPLVTIETGASVIDVTANGIPISIDLLSEGVQSFAAVMFGTQPGTFNIVAATNDTFKLTLDQGTEVTATLTAGAARTRAQVASDINTAVGSTVAYDDTFNGQGSIKILSTLNGRNSHVLIGSGTANDTIGFTAGVLESGQDPTLTAVADALTSSTLNGGEYVAEVDDSAAPTTLVSSVTGVVSGGILTDGSVASFITAGVEGGDLISITTGPNADLSFLVLRVVATQIHLGSAVLDDPAMTYTITKENQKLRLTSLEAGITSALDVGSGNGNARVGFTGAEASTGTVPTVQIEQQIPTPVSPIDSSLFSVVPGDELTIQLGPAASFTLVALETLAGDPVLRITPEVRNNFVDALFDIQSFGATSFDSFIGSLPDGSPDPTKLLPLFIRDSLPIHGYNRNLRVLEESIASTINDFTNAPATIVLADDLIDLLDATTGLQFILPTYSAAEVAALTVLLDALEENGADRMTRLLEEGFVEDALAATKDDYSFAAQSQSAATAVMGDLRNV